MLSANLISHNLLAALLAKVDQESIAIYHEDGELSYGLLQQHIMEMADFYQCHDFPPKARTMLLLPDGVAWVVAYLGAMWAGLTPVAVNPCTPVHELKVIQDLVCPSLIITDTMCQPLLQAAKINCPAIYFVSHYQDLLQLLTKHHPISAVSQTPDEELFWVFTSGSTGQPKAVIHTAAAILHSIQCAHDIMEIQAHDRLYATSRLFFAYPLANVLFAALGCGASMILHRAWPNCENMAMTIQHFQPTVVFSVPLLYRELLAYPDFAELLKSVRCCVSAGEHLSDYLIQAWRSISPIPLINGYGMSETLSFILYSKTDTSVGLKAAPGVAVYSSHQRLHRLCFTHPGLYQRHITLTEEWICPTLYISDDIFIEVAPQQFKFQCRADFLFKVKGRFIHSGEEESQLLTYCGAALKEAAVICETNGVGESQVVWCLVANSTYQRDYLEHKLHALTQRLPTYHRPAVWRYYDVLPRTSTGKILYRQLIQDKGK